jgi:hypothetical protein
MGIGGNRYRGFAQYIARPESTGVRTVRANPGKFDLINNPAQTSVYNIHSDWGI